MRKIIMTVVAAVAILVGGLVTATPASAYALPPDASGYKFWSTDICVEPGAGIPDDISAQTTYRLAYIAQQWNLRAPIINLDYSTDCNADGYPPSRRMVVGTFSNTSNNDCIVSTNTESAYSNGMWRWTNGPGEYINVRAGCTDNQARRDKLVSVAIGERLGLKNLNSEGYNSRVMNFTSWSWANATLPDQNSGNTVQAIYGYTYCQPFGTVC